MRSEDRIQVSSTLKNISHVRKWIASHLASSPFSSKVQNEIKVAVSEALTNVIKYSYHNDESRQIEISIADHPDRLVIEIRDSGEKFQRERYRPPDLSVMSEGGYGVFLIHKFMDEVTYDYSLEEGNLLRMIKHKKSSCSGQEE